MHALAGLFAVAVWGYAVMSNHLHVVVQMLPDIATNWPDQEVAERWIRLFPRADASDAARALRVQALLGNPDRIAVLRARLSDLSWLMRCLTEPIARRANQEDHCSGRFWEGRFKCQALLDDRAVLAAMAYVDLNPVRAKICNTLEDSIHTSAHRRIVEIQKAPEKSKAALSPVTGIRGIGVLGMNQAEYLQLLDWTGRENRANKSGTISGPAPKVLARFGPSDAQWTRQVLAVGSDFHRAIGSVETLIEKARSMGQQWLQGITTARALAIAKA